MQTPVAQFWIEGIPKPQPRPRMTRRGHTYNPPSADAWKAAVKMACKRAFTGRKPINSPLLLRIVFFMPRPKSLKGPVGCVTHDKRPDIDNLSKAVMDAMTGIAFKDDGIIASLHAEKWYAEKDHRHTGAQVRLFLLD